MHLIVDNFNNYFFTNKYTCMTTADNFIKLVKHPYKFKLFMLAKLPSAFFCGVRVKDLDAQQAIVIVPYKWFSQNPFKSTYFACLAMAAEMSTGLLGLMYIHQRKPAVSMLVISLQANYFKKATGITTFICDDGKAIEATIAAAIESGVGKSIVAKSVGKDEAGNMIAEFFITWSFKSKAS